MPCETITIEKAPTTLTLSNPPDTVDEGESFTVSGKLTSLISPVSNVLIEVMVDGDRIGTGLTDGNGNYSFPVSIPNSGDYEIYASYGGSGRYQSAESSRYPITVQVPVAPPALEVTGIDVPSSAGVDEAFTITVTVANTGGQSGSGTYEITVDGEQYETNDVSLNAGESESYNHDVTINTADDHRVCARMT